MSPSASASERPFGQVIYCRNRLDTCHPKSHYHEVLIPVVPHLDALQPGHSQLPNSSLTNKLARSHPSERFCLPLPTLYTPKNPSSPRLKLHHPKTHSSANPLTFIPSFIPLPLPPTSLPKTTLRTLTASCAPCTRSDAHTRGTGSARSS